MAREVNNNTVKKPTVPVPNVNRAVNKGKKPKASRKTTDKYNCADKDKRTEGCKMLNRRSIVGKRFGPSKIKTTKKPGLSRSEQNSKKGKKERWALDSWPKVFPPGKNSKTSKKKDRLIELKTVCWKTTWPEGINCVDILRINPHYRRWR